MTAVIVPSEFESKLLTIPHHVSGMGKINTVCAIHELAKTNDRILLAGFCGGLNNLRLGDVVTAMTVIEGDYDTGNLEEDRHILPIQPIGEFTRAVLISQDRFLTDNPYGLLVGNVATDMESYAAVHTANKLGITLGIVKIVSDVVGKNSNRDFLASCTTLSSKLEETILKALTTKQFSVNS